MGGSGPGPDGAGVLRVIRRFDRDPRADLALEERLVREAPGEPPVLFVYGWNRPVLVLGHGQDERSVDLRACATLEVPVLRRITGGTGVLHRDDVAASLVLPSDHPWARSIPGLYQRFLAVLVLAMERLDVALQRPPPPVAARRPRSPICFEDDRGETLLAGGRKAIGCAQARRRDRTMVHGMLLRGVDPALQAAVYGVDEARIAAALGPVSTPPPPRSRMAEALADSTAEALGLAAVPESPARP